jgi:membrane-bound metal-dependent hydrolase YbcI (DUF457 family)
MSPGHLALGAAVGAGTEWSAESLGLRVSPGSALVWIGIVTVFSVVPDVDTPASLISMRVKVLGQRVSLSPLRWAFVATHHVLRVLAGRRRADYWMRHRGVTHDVVCTVPAVFLSVTALCFFLHLPVWIALAAALGCAAHVLGDLPTLSGVPLAMPWSRRLYALRLFRAGSRVEVSFVMPALWALATFLTWQAVPPA